MRTPTMPLRLPLSGLFNPKDWFLAFQPVIRYADDGLNVIAYEALLRSRDPLLRHELGSMLMRAENDGSILAVDQWVIRCACAVAQRSHGVQIWVNSSQISFSNNAYIEEAITAISSSGVPNSLVLEMTESADGETPRMVRNIEKLRRSGIGVMLDDIDAGHAKPELLGQEGVIGCKVSRNLTASLITSQASRDRLAEMSWRCASNGKRIVAEGVETVVELAVARSLGVNHLQGFLFGQAKPAHEIQGGTMVTA